MVKMEDSKAGELTKQDLKKQLKSAFVWSFPVFAIYFTQVMATVQMGNGIKVSDLTPTSITTGAMISWVIQQMQGLYLRWSTES